MSFSCYQHKDKAQNLGAQLVKSVASKTSDVAGDGTTTATVLTQAIAREGNKAVAAGFNPMDVKRGIDTAVAVVIEEIKKASKKISSQEEIAQVGTISSESQHNIHPQFQALPPEGVIRITLNLIAPPYLTSTGSLSFVFADFLPMTSFSGACEEDISYS